MNDISELFNFVGKNMGVVVETASGVNSLPHTITDDRILEAHICDNVILSNPSAINGDLTITTTAGSAVIAGTISDTTDITLHLVLKVN